VSEQPHSKDDAKQGYLVALLVIVASIGLGLFGLPRLGRRAAVSDSALVGQPARDFMLPALGQNGPGKPQRLSDLQGKAVLLDFFASWCGPCRQQAPIVERVARRLAGPKLAVIGVDTSDQLLAAQQYFIASEPAYPILFDGDNEGASAFDVTGLPTLVLIDKSGVVRAVETGLVSETELDGLIRAAQGS
jgi:thiol-disulfide isomerase/thioredoxin